MASKRNPNFELLRLISMCMVIVLHALGKSGTLTVIYENSNASAWLAWIFESFSIGAVNIFMLISGYFLINSGFRLSKLLSLVFETVFYSLGAFLVCACLGIVSIKDTGIYDALNYIFPVNMSVYWFVTYYILVYMFSPLINRGIRALKEKELKGLIFIMLTYECFLKSFLPVRLTEDSKGYSFLWLLICYLIGAYIRLYGIKFFEKKRRGLFTYITASILILSWVFLIQFMNEKYGRLKEISRISLEYNHIFVLLSALGIFYFFKDLKEPKERTGKIILFLSPMSLGVYLIHENLTVRYLWQGWVGFEDPLSLGPLSFVLRLIISVVLVLISGLFVDYLRIKLFKALGKVINKLGYKDFTIPKAL